MKRCTEHPYYTGTKKPIERWTVNDAVPFGHPERKVPRNISCERCWIIYLTLKGVVTPRSH